MTHLKIIILLLAGLWNIQIIFAQIAPSPFPLTEEQISFKIDSLREVYKPYDEQDFSSLSEAERNKVMIAKGREAILVFAPDYYREYKEPVITVDTVLDSNAPAPRTKYSTKQDRRIIIASRNREHINKLCYKISFPYDPAKENLAKLRYIAVFGVLLDTGEPVGLSVPISTYYIPFDEQPFEERVREKHSAEYRIKYQPYVERRQ